MSIASELERLQLAKANIKTAIENNGVDISENATLDAFPDYVSAMAEAQYASGQSAGGGGATGSKVVIMSSSYWDGITVVDAANTMAMRAIPNNYSMVVSSGGVASQIYLMSNNDGNYGEGGQAIVSSGGAVSGINIGSNCNLIISNGGIASDVQGNGTLNVNNGGVVGNATITSGNVYNSGTISSLTLNNPSYFACNNGVISTFVFSKTSDYIDTYSANGTIHYLSAMTGGLNNLAVTISSASIYGDWNNSQEIELVGSGRIQSANISGNGWVLLKNGASGNTINVSGSGTSNGGLAIQSYGSASNVVVDTYGMMTVGASAMVQTVAMYGSGGMNYNGYTYTTMGGLDVAGTSAIASGVTIYNGGVVTVSYGGLLVSPVVSSGGTIYFTSGSATNIDSKAGANIYVMVDYWTSSAISGNYTSNGCNITFLGDAGGGGGEQGGESGDWSTDGTGFTYGSDTKLRVTYYDTTWELDWEGGLNEWYKYDDGENTVTVSYSSSSDIATVTINGDAYEPNDWTANSASDIIGTKTWYLGASTASITIEWASSSSGGEQGGGSYPASTQSGTLANPLYWDSIVDSNSSRKQTVSISQDGSDVTINGTTYDVGYYQDATVTANTEHCLLFSYVYLENGITYSFGVQNLNAGDYIIVLCDLSGDALIFGDDSPNPDTINGILVSDAFTYTPSSAGWYKLGAGNYSISDTAGAFTIVIDPAPTGSGSGSGSGGGSSPTQLTVAFSEHQYDDANGTYMISDASTAGTTSAVYTNGDYQIKYQNSQWVIGYFGSMMPEGFIYATASDLLGTWTPGTYGGTCTVS